MRRAAAADDERILRSEKVGSGRNRLSSRRLISREYIKNDGKTMASMSIPQCDLITYTGEDDSTEVYAFKVNMDNTPLLNEIKLKRLDDEPARNQFLYANVLIGLSLLLDHKQRSDSRPLNGGDEQAVMPIEDRVEMTCRALAPFLLALTSLASQDLTELEQIDGLEEAG